MRADKPQPNTSSMRQKATLIAVVIVIVIVIWQVVSMFRGGPSEPTATPTKGATPTTQPVALNAQPPPQQAALPKPEPLTPAQAQLAQMQEELEARYISSVNALQMLKVQQEIEATNQAIATAQLATVKAQTGILNLLSPPPPPASYAPNLVTPQKPGTVVTEPNATTNYTVVSVTKLLDKWRAVLGFQGSLFQVQVGDILPPDQSQVVSIDNSGVILRKDETTRRISLVPII